MGSWPFIIIQSIFVGGWIIQGPAVVGMRDAEVFLTESNVFSQVGQTNVARLTNTATLLNDEIKARARHSLVNDIKGGAFVEEWTRNSAASTQRLRELLRKSLAHPMSLAEDHVISLIQGSAR